MLFMANYRKKNKKEILIMFLKEKNRKEKNDLKEALNNFILEKKAEKKSDSTITFYRDNNNIFLKFLKSENIYETTGVDKKTIQRFLVWLDENEDYNYNTTSANTVLRAIRVFVYWMQEQVNIKISNFKIKLLPNSNNKKKDIYSEEELKKLLKKPKIKKVRFSEYRNWVIINFFLATGARRKTVINVKNKDIDFQTDTINLYNYKARRWYDAELYPKIRKILKKYMSIRQGDPDDYLFCTEHGNKFSGSGFRSAIQRYNFRKGVDKANIHSFRRTFASIWINNGGDQYILADLLDHSNMDITREYVQQYGNSHRSRRKNPLESINVGKGSYISTK